MRFLLCNFCQNTCTILYRWISDNFVFKCCVCLRFSLLLFQLYFKDGNETKYIIVQDNIILEFFLSNEKRGLLIYLFIFKLWSDMIKCNFHGIVVLHISRNFRFIRGLISTFIRIILSFCSKLNCVLFLST